MRYNYLIQTKGEIAHIGVMIMANKEFFSNIGALVAVIGSDTAILSGHLVAERSGDFVVATPKYRDDELQAQLKYQASFSPEKTKELLLKGWALAELVTVFLDDQLFEYKHFYKNDCYYEVKHSPKATPKIYSPVKCFNPEFNLAVGFFGCSENELPELDKIIITSIGNENFYYHWNGMPFVSKKYMIQNQEDLKLGVARIASNYDGQHVIHDKKDQIVNLEKWFEQYCQETDQAA